MRRIATAVLFAVVVAIGFTVSAYAEDYFVMNCQQIWPFC